MDACPEFSPTHRTLIPNGGDEFGDVAGEFSATLLDGSVWRFSERGTGCESYLFFTYLSLNDAVREASDDIWNSRLDELFTKGARNVHYLFMSDEPVESVRSIDLKHCGKRC